MTLQTLSLFDEPDTSLTAGQRPPKEPYLLSPPVVEPPLDPAAELSRRAAALGPAYRPESGIKDTRGLPDVAATIAMLDLVRVLKDAGHFSRLTTGGVLDSRKAKRFCNALLGRPVSDRPAPTPDDWLCARIAASDISPRLDGRWLSQLPPDDPNEEVIP